MSRLCGYLNYFMYVVGVLRGNMEWVIMEYHNSNTEGRRICYGLGCSTVDHS